MDTCLRFSFQDFALAPRSPRIRLPAFRSGIGHYTRFQCRLTVGWTRGGGSHTNASAWPCHTGALKPVSMGRAVPITYTDNVCTHSYSYVWYGEKEWTEHIDWMALQGVNVFLAMAGQEEVSGIRPWEQQSDWTPASLSSPCPLPRASRPGASLIS